MRTVANQHRVQTLPNKRLCKLIQGLPRWTALQTLPCTRSISGRRIVAVSSANGTQNPQEKEGTLDITKREDIGASTDLGVIYSRLVKLAMPYWVDPEVGASARWKLAGVVGLTLATTGVSVVFNFLGRDFFNALSEKNEALFGIQLVKYLGSFVVGIPVFVFKSYYQSTLALEWRAWMTKKLLEDYLTSRTFYTLQSQASVDNPDQRISSDAADFTGTAINLSLTLLNAAIDLISFAGILFSIYPPLFAALLAYSIGGTGLSLWLGRPLVGLNFQQEAREADLRYGLVRVRENAESVAFYRGERDEQALLEERLRAAVENYLGLLVASRNLDFFTSFYRYLIQLLPAAVVAPLYFQGKIEFGVINQSQSAFNHVLSDLSLVVYQFQSLAGFSAVIDRLGQFTEAMADASTQANAAASVATSSAAALPATSTSASTSASSTEHFQPDTAAAKTSASPSPAAEGGVPELSESEALPVISLHHEPPAAASASTSGRAGAGESVLELKGLGVLTPDRSTRLVAGLDLVVRQGESLLVMGPSGAGKTSILRAVAGLWNAGEGEVVLRAREKDVMFLPQRPYMVLGTLRDQVLYPRFPVRALSANKQDTSTAATSTSNGTNGSNGSNGASGQDVSAKAEAAAQQQNGGNHNEDEAPDDERVVEVLRRVRLGHLLYRYDPRSTTNGNGNGSVSSAGSEAGSISDAGTSTSTSGTAVPATSTTSSTTSTTGQYPALDAKVDWAASLSLGEQQRLAWARLLLAQPRLALLDEASSALDQATEEELYKALASSGITYISVGHRSTLRQFHASLLTITPVPAAAPASASPGQPQQGQGGATWQLQQGEGAREAAGAASGSSRN